MFRWTSQSLTAGKCPASLCCLEIRFSKSWGNLVLFFHVNYTLRKEPDSPAWAFLCHGCKLRSWEGKFSSLFFLDRQFPHRKSCVYHHWKNQKLWVNTDRFSLIFIMLVQVQIYSKIFTAVYLQYTNGKLSRK